MDKTTEINVPDHVRGEIAYALTRRLVIDMPTARAAVDDAVKAFSKMPAVEQRHIDKAYAVHEFVLIHDKKNSIDHIAQSLAIAEERGRSDALSVTPEVAAERVAPAKPPRDCGITGGDLIESRDNIGSAYTRSTTPPAITKEPTP